MAAERKRHDKALEKYQADWAAWQKSREKLADWEAEQERLRNRADQDTAATNRALDLYAQTHPRPTALMTTTPHNGATITDLRETSELVN